MTTDGSGTGSVESGPAEHIDISAEQVAEGVTVVRVSGEVDMLTAPRLRSEVVERITPGGVLVLDLGGVGFLGSAGLAVLVEAAQRSTREQAAFRVVAVERAVLRPLAATGLGEVFSVHPSVAEALDADRG
ncbi:MULTISPECIES: STAS domain-containing protein [Actinosynnema]|uniref:STAS domain-containing protein n=1 Tax=Actinosynnema TaxID=40566 RepID=UPI0020A5E46C|nr:STAS domain-containing protein [Actinosynnema pretiosum]